MPQKYALFTNKAHGYQLLAKSDQLLFGDRSASATKRTDLCRFTFSLDLLFQFIGASGDRPTVFTLLAPCCCQRSKSQNWYRYRDCELVFEFTLLSARFVEVVAAEPAAELEVVRKHIPLSVENSTGVLMLTIRLLRISALSMAAVLFDDVGFSDCKSLFGITDLRMLCWFQFFVATIIVTTTIILIAFYYEWPA